jgi:hypothetical protein
MDLECIFGDVVKKILLLLKFQMRKLSDRHLNAPPPIMLVGGFGSSEYLLRRVKEQFPESQVVQPPEA